MRIVFGGEEAAFCVGHLGEVVVDVLCEFAGGEDVVVGFLRGAILGGGRGVGGGVARVAEGAVGGGGAG